MSIQQGPPEATIQQDGVGQRRAVNVSSVRVLAIIEVIIGLVTLTFGLALLLYPDVDNVLFGGAGVVEGSLISVARAFGIVLYKAPQSHCKNGLHMAFSILVCYVSFLGVGVFSVGVITYSESVCTGAYSYLYPGDYCYSQRLMKKSNGILLFLLIAEFIVGLTSAIFICMFAYCGTNEYCVKSQIGNQNYIARNASGQTSMVPAYPPGSVHQYVSSSGSYTNQSIVSQTGERPHVVSSAHYYPKQVVTTQAGATGGFQGATSVTYSCLGPPPAYEENEQLVNTSQ